MIKRIAFVVRNPSLSTDEFHARWRGPHAELLAKNPAVQDHMLRYELNHRKPRDYDRTDCPYDGAFVQWYESMDAVAEMRSDSRFTEVPDDAAALLDTNRTLEIFTHEEQVVIAGPDERPDPLTKLVCGVRKKPGMDRDAFHTYWWEVHGPLNRDTPAVRKYFIRYEQNHRLESDFAAHRRRPRGCHRRVVPLDARLLRHGDRPRQPRRDPGRRGQLPRRRQPHLHPHRRRRGHLRPPVTPKQPAACPISGHCDRESDKRRMGAYLAFGASARRARGRARPSCGACWRLRRGAWW